MITTEELRIRAAGIDRAKDEFVEAASEALSELIDKLGKNGVLDTEFTMTTEVIQNDEVSGSIGSEFEWSLESLCKDDDGEITLTCEGSDFLVGDFEPSSIVELVQFLREEDD